jgi:hypothetical protein
VYFFCLPPSINFVMEVNRYAGFLKPMQNVVIMNPPTWCFLSKICIIQQACKFRSRLKHCKSQCDKASGMCKMFNCRRTCGLSNPSSGNNVPYCYQILHPQCENACTSIPNSTCSLLQQISSFLVLPPSGTWYRESGM